MATVPSDARTTWLVEIDEAAGVLEAVRASLDEVELVARRLVAILEGGGTIYACGNGGSALEAQHFAAELVGHYRRDRRSLPCIALSADSGVMTAISNDYDFRSVFARQVEGVGRAGDALVGFSTSGTSLNVVEAIRAARAIGMLTVALTGGDGGSMPGLADHVLVIRGARTARAQEGHMLLVHLISEYIDAAFGDGGSQAMDRPLAREAAPRSARGRVR